MLKAGCDCSLVLLYDPGTTFKVEVQIKK